MGYKPSREKYFYNYLVSESDGYGRSISVTFRIQPSLDYDFMGLVRSGRLPFQTREDAARWAFCLGVRSLSSIREFDYSSWLLRFPIRLYLKEPSIRPGEFVKRVETTIRHLSGLGYHSSQLRKFLSVIEDLVECLPAAYDREEYLKEMEPAWPRIAQATCRPSVSNDPSDGNVVEQPDCNSLDLQKRVNLLEEVLSEAAELTHMLLLELTTSSETISRHELIEQYRIRLTESPRVVSYLLEFDTHLGNPLRKSRLNLARIRHKSPGTSNG